MKATLPRIILTLVAALLFLVFALVVSTSAAAAVPDFRVNDSIRVEKKITSRIHKVALYPDALQKVLFFTVKGENGRVYQLYLFDIDGKLVKQKEIRNNQTTYISDFDKGIYVYDVFCDDERIGNGQIAVL